MKIAEGKRMFFISGVNGSEIDAYPATELADLTAVLAISPAMFRRSLSAGADIPMSFLVAGLGKVLAGLTRWSIVSHPRIDAEQGSIITMNIGPALVLRALPEVNAVRKTGPGDLLSLRSNRGRQPQEDLHELL